MTPTAYLRFVERPGPEKVYDPIDRMTHTIGVKILQQWWADHSCDVLIHGNPGGTAGEWRDVPMEKVET